MSKYSFNLDVTHLVYETQQRQLMLYPLLVYILGKAAQVRYVAWQSAVMPQQTTVLWAKLDENFASFFKTYALESFAHIENDVSALQKQIPPSDTLYILSLSPQNADSRQAIYLYNFHRQNEKAFLQVTVQADYTKEKMEILRQEWQRLCHAYNDFGDI